jgi:hypothetical protein
MLEFQSTFLGIEQLVLPLVILQQQETSGNYSGTPADYIVSSIHLDRMKQ